MRRGCNTPVGRSSCGVSSGPKQRTSVFAMGRAETPITSRTTPPTPVFAPPKGSSAEGWLCVSTLKETSCTPSYSTIPALSTNAERTQGAAISSVAALR